MAPLHRRRVGPGRCGLFMHGEPSPSTPASSLTPVLQPQEFLAVYRTLRDQLADDPIIADQPPAAREWLVEVTGNPPAPSPARCLLPSPARLMVVATPCADARLQRARRKAESRHGGAGCAQSTQRPRRASHMAAAHTWLHMALSSPWQLHHTLQPVCPAGAEL